MKYYCNPLKPHYAVLQLSKNPIFLLFEDYKLLKYYISKNTDLTYIKVSKSSVLDSPQTPIAEVSKEKNIFTFKLISNKELLNLTILSDYTL